MDYGKYIVIESNCSQAILFDNTMNHGDFLSLFNRDCIKSAGFFQVSAKASEHDSDDIQVSVFGKSTSLKLETNGKFDEMLIKRILRKAMY